jgi:perosamine synthetase
MKPVRTLPPTAAPVGLVDLMFSALEACASERSQARFERELKAYFGVEHVFLVSSGKAALTLTLQALHSLRPARRVVIPAYTCFSVPAAVIRAGFEPVLVDVDPATLDFDERSLKRALEYRDVLCAIPTHLFGVPFDIERIRSMARRPDLFVVEDAAQAFGLTAADGRKLGTIGDVGVFSLGRGKHLTAGGGGIIATKTASIADRCADVYARLPKPGAIRAARMWAELVFMSVFINPRFYWLPAGLPFLGLGETVYDPQFSMTRMPATAFGALRRWRARLEAANQARESVSDAWARELDVRMPHQRALLRFPLLASSYDERAVLLDRARSRGLGASRMYPTAIHRIPALRGRFGDQRFPGADTLASRLITLPTHEYVAAGDQVAFRKISAEAGLPVTGPNTTTAAASC